MITRDQVRAARMLLDMHQPELAILAGIGVATLRRFESGHEIGRLHLDAIERALTEAGVIMIAEGSRVDNRIVGAGVALKRRATSPEK